MPAPLGPSRPVTPGPSPNVMSLTATTLPYQRETCSTASAGAGPPAGAATDGALVGAVGGIVSVMPRCSGIADRPDEQRRPDERCRDVGVSRQVDLAHDLACRLYIEQRRVDASEDVGRAEQDEEFVADPERLLVQDRDDDGRDDQSGDDPDRGVGPARRVRRDHHRQRPEQAGRQQGLGDERREVRQLLGEPVDQAVGDEHTTDEQHAYGSTISTSSEAIMPPIFASA